MLFIASVAGNGVEALTEKEVIEPPRATGVALIDALGVTPTGV